MLIATVAGMGSALLATYLVIFTVAPLQHNPSPRSWQALAAALIGGAAITAIAYGRLSSRIAIAVRGALASILAVAVIWLGFIFDDETSGSLPGSASRARC